MDNDEKLSAAIGDGFNDAATHKATLEKRLAAAREIFKATGLKNGLDILQEKTGKKFAYSIWEQEDHLEINTNINAANIRYPNNPGSLSIQVWDDRVVATGGQKKENLKFHNGHSFYPNEKIEVNLKENDITPILRFMSEQGDTEGYRPTLKTLGRRLLGKLKK